MKKLLKYLWIFLPILGVAIVVASNQWLNSGGITLPNGEQVSPEELHTQAVLDIIAAQTNKALPRKVDQATELRNVEGRDGELVYKYVKIKASSDQFDKSQFVAEMRPKALDLACNSPDLNVFLANGVSARYSFHGSDHQPIGEIVVTPAQCGY